MSSSVVKILLSGPLTFIPFLFLCLGVRFRVSGVSPAAGLKIGSLSQSAYPATIDVPQYIRRIKEGKFNEAFEMEYGMVAG